jgi:hypothetical protein
MGREQDWRFSAHKQWRMDAPWLFDPALDVMEWSERAEPRALQWIQDVPAPRLARLACNSLTGCSLIGGGAQVAPALNPCKWTHWFDNRLQYRIMNGTGNGPEALAIMGDRQ